MKRLMQIMGIALLAISSNAGDFRAASTRLVQALKSSGITYSEFKPMNLEVMLSYKSYLNAITNSEEKQEVLAFALGLQDLNLLWSFLLAPPHPTGNALLDSRGVLLRNNTIYLKRKQGKDISHQFELDLKFGQDPNAIPSSDWTENFPQKIKRYQLLGSGKQEGKVLADALDSAATLFSAAVKASEVSGIDSSGADTGVIYQEDQGDGYVFYKMKTAAVMKKILAYTISEFGKLQKFFPKPNSVPDQLGESMLKQ